VRLLLKKVSRKLALVLLPFIGSLFIRFLALTNKKVFHLPESVSDKPIIFACWHGELLMVPFLYFRYRSTPHAKILISEHFDGKLISKTIRYFGLDTLSGSTSRGGAKVLIQAIKSLKNGYDIGITPDGPKGPRHKVSDGVVIMAQKTGANVILIKIKASSYWQLKSWDKFIIPKPFGTIEFFASKEIDLSGMSLDEAKSVIKKGFENYE